MNPSLGILSPLIGEHALLASFLFLLLFGFTIPISEEIALSIVGVGAWNSDKGFLEICGVAALALSLADLIYYGLARILGPRLLRSKLFSRIVKPEKIESGERYFKVRGPRIVFVCRFVVGLRLPALLSAGLLRLKRFILYDGAALVICVPVWIAVGHALGAQLDSHVGWLGKLFAVAGVVAAMIGSLLTYRSVKADTARVEAGQLEDAAE
jgi:membrane protein DedA with SNARE-associated domain